MRRVDFDSASTTNLNTEVLKTYISLLEKNYVNSEALYDEGVAMHLKLEKARAVIASLLQVETQEIIFTSGASEANSAAIKGVCFAGKEKKHILTTSIEHSSIRNAVKQMADVFGYEVTYLPVNKESVILLEDVKKALREDTAIVSVMAVNNEVGSIQPIQEVGEFVKKHSHAYFHVDLTQAIGKIDLNMKYIDLASMSAHKMNGLKGSGLLVKKRHVPFVPLINGGEQEFGLRGGTANALADLVLAKTLRLYLEDQKKNLGHIQALKERMVHGLEALTGVYINSPVNSIANIVNFSYPKIPSEVMQNALNQKGFMVSAKSTCDSKSTEPSDVLMAMGLGREIALSSIRVSFHSDNTLEEVDTFLKVYKEVIQQYGSL
ncbi:MULTISPECIES: cysteine desulfurase family protein [Terrabacteria group]|uniref:cysteine desulfurase family protein n=1 Tax=Bacillati TaxID=1783272 RepID=UPI0019397DEA|nr:MULTISPECIES: cysteine desulfurase family protein [Terrabacteria group]MBW9211916.1 cysteine desulfurase [Trueperella sp. zg.1013]QRG87283.1 cysteine desulfurase [Bulleidia sp. zg-1006]